MAPDPELPPACLPGEEPLIDLETWDKAGRALVSAGEGAHAAVEDQRQRHDHHRKQRRKQ